MPTIDENEVLALLATHSTASQQPIDSLLAEPQHDHADGELAANEYDDLFDPALLEGLDFADVYQDALGNGTEPDYSKHEDWIPRFTRPAKPCDYCHSRRLQCYITRDEAACTPCASLFRQCSLTNTNAVEANRRSTGHLGAFVDTLHVVDEDTAKEQGTLTGTKSLRSTIVASGTSTPVRDDAPGSSKRNGIRFPRQVTKTLRDWLDSHSDNPYPTEEEKAELERKTELTPSQIANWLANARRRRKAARTATTRSPGMSSPTSSTSAIAIPKKADKPWDELNPFERWKHSPPENEPASITDIANAIANRDPTEKDDAEEAYATTPSSYRNVKQTSSGSSWSIARAPSTVSTETVKSSSISASVSASTALSHDSSQQSFGSFGSFSSGLAGKRDRRRRKRVTLLSARQPNEKSKRIFQCTFCTDTFKAKYDWTRHEKSLHLSLEKWICAPIGPVIVDAESGSKKCVYCDTYNPSDAHIEQHNHRQCEDKGIDARTFFRKDHLRQHVRLMHNCEMTPSMDAWKITADNIVSRCGFCGKRFTVWQERVDHLTAHFKSGARMTEWKGCRGLDPAVAAQVTNAMPPYLIGMESVSPNPFSATIHSTCPLESTQNASDPALAKGDTAAAGDDNGRQLTESEANMNGYSSSPTCWEVLTVHLGQFANKMAKSGIVITDEMLQAEARLIAYESDDPWNQTAADNPEWLDLFKKAHGLDFIPSTIGGQGEQVPEDLETYGDLGLRVPFALKLKAYNQRQHDEAMKIATDADVPTTKSLVQSKDWEARELYVQLNRDGLLHPFDYSCGHVRCEYNIVDVSAVEVTQATGPHYRRWCNHELPHSKMKKLVYIGATANNLTTSSITDPNSTTDPPNAFSTPMPKSSFLQRHHYALPADRAQRFATTTGPWVDSGLMPAPTDVASSQKPNFTTSGAMMEFLGGDLGAMLPFSADVFSETIAMPPPEAAAAAAEVQNDLDWTVPDVASQEDEAFLRELGDAIMTTTSVEAGGASTTTTTAPTLDQGLPLTAVTSFGGDGVAGVSSSDALMADEFNFDDLCFDDVVFDVPMQDHLDDAVA